VHALHTFRQSEKSQLTSFSLQKEYPFKERDRSPCLEGRGPLNLRSTPFLLHRIKVSNN
jgi:hypothetical protein